MSDQPDPREEPKAIIGYHGGLWSVKLSHGHYAQYIPDFRSKEDAQFYVDAKLREWGYEPQQQRMAALEAQLAEYKHANHRLKKLKFRADIAFEAFTDTDFGCDDMYSNEEVAAWVLMAKDPIGELAAKYRQWLESIAAIDDEARAALEDLRPNP